MLTLREARIRKYLTVRVLAASAGVSPTTVHLIEKGRRAPHFNTILRIAEALGCPPEEISEFGAALNGATRE